MINEPTIELLIKKIKESRYKATSPTFPICKGFGNTKEEAIDHLCNSISNFIQKTAKHFLKTTLHTSDYSEVITDPNNTDTLQHRIIDLNPTNNSKTPTQKIFIKSIDQNLSSLMDRVPANTLQPKSNMPQFKELLTDPSALTNQDNPLIFGIHLCLN